MDLEDSDSLLVTGAVIVMGVSGAGKTAIGRALAEALMVPFLDADDLHPAANKAKMAAGHPLDDDDRMPWLDLVASAAARAGDVVVACSALQCRYRDRLRSTLTHVRFLELDVSRPELKRRLARRSHEFMPETFLDSQLATLETLRSSEVGWRIDADLAAREVVQRCLLALGTEPSARSR